MVTIYGSRDTNPFQIPNRNARYYLLVNSETGETAVKTTEGTTFIPGLIGGESADRTVGTFYVKGPNAGKFIPESDALNEEKQYLSSIDGQKSVKNQAVITAQRGGATNAQQLIFPNTATTSPQQPGQAGTPPPAPVLPSPGIGNPVELQEPITISSGPIRYPKNIKDEQDRIKFQAVEIQPRTGTGAAGSLQFGFGEPIYKVLGDGPVIMAIQSPISDQNSVDWGPDSVNAIDSALFNLSKGFIGAQGKEPTGTDLGFDLYKIAKDNQGRILNYIAGQAAGINNVLSRTDGVVLNPNLELLFQGPQLRPFTFTFKMSARSQSEADDIKKIIKYFKYHMAVRKDERDLFLKAPHVFTIQYEKGIDKIHPGINLISPSSDKKACALTNCSVDYTPLGSYMTYEDGTMVAYTLNLQFQEITPIYNTDYETEPGKSHPIGY